MDRQNKTGQEYRPTLPKRLLALILRAFFKLLYHQFAWTYDWVASIVSLNSWQRWVQSPLPYIYGPKTLEIAFGPGHLQESLNQNGITCFGLDESTQMTSITYRRLKRLGFIPNLVRGMAQNLPFRNESFDQVVMTFPAEFILTTSTFAESNRVLNAGGCVIIIPLAWITGQKPLQKAFAWLNSFTGEAPVWNEKYLDPLKSLGFDVFWEMINFDDSKVLLIRLIKPVHQQN